MAYRNRLQKLWISVLETSFIVFRLPAFHTNLRTRLVKMPKLHFYDTGLVCWLLGIRSTDQLRTHPLRGAIFETWVVSEILKHRTNRGETAGLSFYRDRDTVETDLIIEHANHLTLVDARAAQTASARLFDGARRVRDHLVEPLRPCDVVIAYGGHDVQIRSNAKLVPWARLHEEKWTR